MRTPQQAVLAVLNDGTAYAFGMGRNIQSRLLGDEKWNDFHGVAPGFSNPNIRWRVKPDAMKEVPFTRLTIPKGAIWTFGGGASWLTIRAYDETGVLFEEKEFVSYESLGNLFKYSRDGGETWHPGHDFIDP